MPAFRKSRFAVEVPIENLAEGTLAVFQTMTRGFILVPENGWRSFLNDPASPATDEATVRTLLDQGFIVSEKTDELAVFENWRQQHIHQFDAVRSKVLVTRKCNNRCRYCIVDPEAGTMSHETALAMDRFYMEFVKEKNPGEVNDEYSGGEVLLNPRVVLESASRRYYFCMGRGIDYGFQIITNGTLLTPLIISRFKEVGLKGIRVSVAGPAPVHDKLRPSKGNGKTYEIIMRNLEAISGMIPISLECQYDSGAEDYRLIPEMMDEIAARGIAIKGITFTPILPRRTESSYISGLGDPDIYFYLLRESQKRGFPQLGDAPSNACATDFRSRLTFDTDGTLIPCPAVQSGEFVYGDARSGIDFVAESGLRRRNYPEKCLKECDILPLCMGGCRLQALTNDGDFNGVDCQYEVLVRTLKEYVIQKAAENLSAQAEESPAAPCVDRAA